MLTDEELEQRLDENPGLMFGSPSDWIKEWRWAYDRACEDCAKACEKLDEGFGEVTVWALSPDVCRALKHKEGE